MSSALVPICIGLRSINIQAKLERDSLQTIRSNKVSIQITKFSNDFVQAKGPCGTMHDQ